jgi:glutamate synthase domain-containing protein 2
MNPWLVAGMVLLVLLVATALWDITQRRHAILRNFPVIGHFRYLLESVGPELRQYIVTNNNEERPFSRDQRSWIYASAKRQNNLVSFGTDQDLERSPNYIVIKHSAFPWPEPPKPEDGRVHVAGKVLGGFRKRPRAFRPPFLYVSAMSYGSLSGAAVEAINRGCGMSGVLHNTGEGGISRHHLQGADLIWQLGTGYFGARDESGNFSLARLRERVEVTPTIRAIEIKLSQGAKPGKGGMLPGSKVTPEIAEIRGIPQGKDCMSPPYHRAFRNADELLDFVERIADETGLPVGIKSAVGGLEFFEDLARLMESGTRGIDYLAIDGGEGGTGAAPLVFTDHVALPFKIAFARVYRIFAERGLQDRLLFAGSGRLGFPEQTALAFALGCDMVGVAREPMMAIGCIQAQLCHTGKCPTGVATQNRWLVRGLDVTDKSVRMANYALTLDHDVMALARACGVAHPAMLTLDHIEVLDDRLGSRSAREVFGYQKDWTLPPPEARAWLENHAA